MIALTSSLKDSAHITEREEQVCDVKSARLWVKCSKYCLLLFWWAASEAGCACHVFSRLL